MSRYECTVCGYLYDSKKEKTQWDNLSNEWVCEVCESEKKYFNIVSSENSLDETKTDIVDLTGIEDRTDYLSKLEREGDEREIYMKDIHAMSETGASIIEPMRTSKPVISWDDILIKGAQLATLPLNKNIPVCTTTIIGPKAKHPLVIETPVIISHMSFGALSREIKTALAQGSAVVKTAICSGEGGILPEEHEKSYAYIFEYVPNLYSVTDDNLRNVDAVEIKFGQSAKPGMGGHLPGKKVTSEIAKVRGFSEGEDIHSPAHFQDIQCKEDLKKKVEWLREKTGGKPIGIKIACGHLEKDLDVVFFAEPDFITIDGRAGATAASLKYVKAATSIPTLFAVYRARKHFDKRGIKDITLVVTGGLRIAPDFVKALALGADVIAIATAALIACGCQQYRVCETGKCPMGITTQDPELRKRIKIEKSAERLSNYLRVSTNELKAFARLTGKSTTSEFEIKDLCTTNSEISSHTDVEHV